MPESSSPTLMRCHEIEHGMIFNIDNPVIWEKWERREPYTSDVWIVLSADERAERRNRFFCCPKDDDTTRNARIVLFCFDVVFSKSVYNFRFPNEAT